MGFCRLFIFFVYYLCMDYIYFAENVMPFKLLNKTRLETSLLCSVLALVPATLMIILVFFLRLFTKYLDFSLPVTFRFLSFNLLILSNTIEHTCLFIINLLAASDAKLLKNERIFFVCFGFLGARFLYWAGFLLEKYWNYSGFKTLGLLLTSTNSCILLYLNLSTIGLISF